MSELIWVGNYLIPRGAVILAAGLTLIGGLGLICGTGYIWYKFIIEAFVADALS